MRRWIVLLGLASTLASCTFEAGSGFGTLEGADLRASFEPGGRLGEDGSFLVMGGYRVLPESMSLEIGELRLDELETSDSGGGGVFDPANPPPGYTLCHGGHCHTEDGRLVPYEDIQAELASGGSSEYLTMVRAVVDDELDLLEGATRELTDIAPSRELREGRISRVALDLGRFRAAGTVTGGALEETVLPIRIDVRVDGALSTLEADREVSVDAEPAVTVMADVGVAADFLDGQDLSAAVEGGVVVVEDGPVADAVALKILSASFGVDLQ
jgi:hypothetical protein